MPDPTGGELALVRQLGGPLRSRRGRLLLACPTRQGLRFAPSLRGQPPPGTGALAPLGPKVAKLSEKSHLLWVPGTASQDAAPRRAASRDGSSSRFADVSLITSQRRFSRSVNGCRPACTVAATATGRSIICSIASRKRSEASSIFPSSSM